MTAPSQSRVIGATSGGGGTSIKIVSAATSLSTGTPNNTSFQQWGTEEAVAAQASCPVAAVVLAWLSGRFSPGPGGAAEDRGSVKLQVSFDGGSSWADIGPTETYALFTSTSGRGNAVSLTGRATGTVTGDIQVRAMVVDVDTANDTTWVGGYITVLVIPQ